MSWTIVGQWQGISDAGLTCVVNIGRRGDKLEGRVTTYTDVELAGKWHQLLLSSVFSAKEKSDFVIEGKIEEPSFHDQFGALLDGEDIKAKISDREFHIHSIFNGKQTDAHTLEISWVSHYPSASPQQDHIRLVKKKHDGSRVAHRHMSWSDFKEFELR